MDLVQMKTGVAAAVGLLGYAVVFAGLVILMFVIMLMSRQFIAKAESPAKEMPEPSPAVTAPGTAGELMLYDTDPKDAAMIMAIVADELKTPVNELRFISIREVKES